MLLDVLAIYVLEASKLRTSRLYEFGFRFGYLFFR